MAKTVSKKVRLTPAELIEQASILQQEEKDKATKALQGAEKRNKSAQDAVPLAEEAFQEAQTSGNSEAVKLAFDEILKARKTAQIAKERLERARNNPNLSADLASGSFKSVVSFPSQESKPEIKDEKSESEDPQSEDSEKKLFPKWVLWVLLVIMAIMISLLLFGGFAPAEKAPAVVAPVVSTPISATPVVVEKPIVEPVVVEEDADLIELGTGETIATGLKDPNANPTVTLQPGEGVLWSSDPGGANVSGVIVDYENQGSMGYLFNDSDQPVEVVFHTGWNAENERWNISPVLFQVNELSALREHTQNINQDEQKPMFFGRIWNGSELLYDPDLY